MTCTELHNRTSLGTLRVTPILDGGVDDVKPLGGLLFYASVIGREKDSSQTRF